MRSSNSGRVWLSSGDAVFTTKLKNNAGVDYTTKAINRSIGLCLGYIDLHLVHGPRAGPMSVGQLGNPEGSLEGWKGESALGLAPLICITCKGCLVADGRAGYRYTQCIMCHENKT